MKVYRKECEIVPARLAAVANLEVTDFNANIVGGKVEMKWNVIREVWYLGRDKNWERERERQ